MQSNRVFTIGKGSGNSAAVAGVDVDVVDRFLASNHCSDASQLVDGYFNCLPTQSNMARVMLQQR